MAALEKIYARLPVWGQHAAVTAFGTYWHWLRFGHGYRRILEEYRNREWWSQSEWDDWQSKQLRRQLELALNHVPHYRQWGAAERSAALAGRLEDLPLLEKKDLRDEPLSFVRDDLHPWCRSVTHTSGTTGTPIKNFWTLEEVRRRLAVREARSVNWAGVSFDLPRATFSGRMVEPNPESQGPYHRFNAVERQVYLSAYHLRPESAAKYLEPLVRHRVRWMTGYAVSFYLLARFMLEQNLQPPDTLEAVVTTSEKLTSEMRAVMKEAYRCPIYEEYSSVENALFVSECPAGRLHVSPDVAVVEILRSDGTPCDPGEVGEVVATCLMRYYHMFIRYRLGDLAAWSPEACPCGRAMPVLKEVVGRIEDVIIGPDGRRMVRFHRIFVDQPHVREGQVIQESLNQITIRVVPQDGFGPADVTNLTRRVQQQLGPEIHVSVETVTEIPRTHAGKFQAVVSRLHDQGVAAAERMGLPAS